MNGTENVEINWHGLRKTKPKSHSTDQKNLKFQMKRNSLLMKMTKAFFICR